MRTSKPKAVETAKLAATKKSSAPALKKPTPKEPPVTATAKIAKKVVTKTATKPARPVAKGKASLPETERRFAPRHAVPGSDVEASVVAPRRETKDFELLNNPSFTQSETWRVLRIQSEFVHSFERMSEVGPAVAVFGSARIKDGDPYYELTREVSRQLALAGWAIITGGGPGLMEAGNRGAREGELESQKLDPRLHPAHPEMNAASRTRRSIGLNVELPFEQMPNPYLDTEINFHYFFCRKTNFVKYASAFVILPGGFGTMDELFESLTLVQTRKIEFFPIVLMGKAYWKGLIDWIGTTMVSHGTITAADLDLLYLTDDPEDAVRHVFEHTRQVRHP